MKIIFYIALILIAVMICYVYKPLQYWRAKKIITSYGNKALLLTFDDGPVPATLPLLDMLDEVGVKVIFYVIGEEASRRPEILKETVRRGHTIGNHSYDHPRFMGWRSKKTIQDQIEKTNTILADSGITPTYIRAPFGETSYRLHAIAGDYNMKHIGWSISTKDWKKDFSPEKLHNIFSNINSSEIVLMHDRAYAKPELLEALKQEILDLKKRGFTFVSMQKSQP